jgi:hypothetical protein
MFSLKKLISVIQQDEESVMQSQDNGDKQFVVFKKILKPVMPTPPNSLDVSSNETEEDLPPLVEISHPVDSPPMFPPLVPIPTPVEVLEAAEDNDDDASDSN